jgi:hypothetical protein
MRDAAALIILQMDKATGISGLSEARRGNLVAQPPAVGTPATGETLQSITQEDPRDDSG